MAGFFDSLFDPEVGQKVVDSMKEPGESNEQMVRRKMPFTSYVDETIGNIPQGLVGSAQGVYEAVTHPRETAQQLAHYATHPRETAANIYQHYADRYGSVPAALQTLRSDPVGVVGDVVPFTSLPGIGRSIARAAPSVDAAALGRRFSRPEQPMRYAADREFGPSMAEGEVTSAPLQLTYRGPQEPPRAAMPEPTGPEGSPGYRDPMLSIMRTDRTSPGSTRRTKIPELRLNTEGPASSPAPMRAAAEENIRPPGPHIPSLDDFTEKSKATLLRLREQQKSPTAFEQRYLDAPFRAGKGFPAHEIIYGQGEGMNPKIYDVLLRAKLGGKPVTPFEQNMINSYMKSFKPSPTMGIHGTEAVGEIGPPKIRDTTLPPSKFEQNWRNAQKQALDKWRAENPRGLERDPRYIPYLEEELPTIYRPKVPAIREETLPAAMKSGEPPIIESGAMGESARDNKILRALGLAANLQDKSRQLPDIDVFNRKAASTEAPSEEKKSGAPFVAETRPSEVPKKAPSTKGHFAKSHPHKAPTKAAPSKARAHGKSAQSDQKYWGDWRDQEPFASDPIGNLIDEALGRKKMARKSGAARREPSPMDLGDLLPFANGGMVRPGYADGGSEDRIPILSDIGDALGGMFGGQAPQQSDAVVAQDRPDQTSALPSYRDASDFFEKWSTNPLSQFLFATGIGAMASDRVNPLQALGEGGIRGLEYMRAAQSAQAEMREKERERAERLRQQRIIEQTLGPAATEEVAPMTTSEVETEEPVKTAAAEVPETAVVAPEVAEQISPEGATAPAPAAATDGEGAAPSASEAPEPSAAESSKKDPASSLYSLHRKISSVMSSVTDPQLRLALANRQKAVEFEISRIEKQRERAAAAQRAAEDRAVKLQQQKRLEEQASPEYKTKVRKAEELGKRLDETEASINSGAQAAQSLIDQFEIYKNAIKSGAVVTGAYGEDRAEAHKAILGLTAGLTGKSSDLRSRLSDNIKAGALQQAFAELGGRLGAGISDADRRAIQQMGISLDRDPESNVDAIETFQNAQRRKLAAAEFMEDYKQNKSSIPGQLDEGFDAAFTKWVNSQPSIVPDRVKNILAGDEKGSEKKAAGPSVVATGTINVDGKTRRVVKYSDGTTKYAD